MGIQDPEIDLGETNQGKRLIEKAIEKGANEKAVLIAKKMIAAGNSDSEIAELTELETKIIKQLRNN